MAFKDGMLDMPLVENILIMRLQGERLSELRDLVLDSEAKLLKFTRVLLKTYVASVFVSATLYLCGPIYLMFVNEDDSLRLLGE